MKKEYPDMTMQCPFMCQQMASPMMQMPAQMPGVSTAPMTPMTNLSPMDAMGNVAPNMMHQMPMEMVHHEEDERDDQMLMGMYPEHCRKMMPYVVASVDRMEKKGDMIYTERLDREMVRMMAEDAYDKMKKDMPELLGEHDKRQFGAQALARDLLGVLILDELFRRRRRQRRRYFDYGYYAPYGYGYFGRDFEDEDIYFED